MKHGIKFVAAILVIGFSIFALSAGWAAEEQKKVNINTATAEELTNLKGVGEVLAQRIIEYREQNGPFKTANDLLNVKGVGPKIFSDNVNLIAVGDKNDLPADKAKNPAPEKPTKTN